MSDFKTRADVNNRRAVAEEVENEEIHEFTIRHDDESDGTSTETEE